MHVCGILAVEAAADDERPPAVALEQGDELALRDPREHGRVGDLEPVQVQDRQHRAVGLRVEQLVRVPARRERARLRLAVADDAGDEQVGVVERGAERVHERVAELAALVDRAGHLGRDVARDPAGEGELTEEPPQPVEVPRHVRVELAVGALEIGVRDERRAAVARAGDVDRAQFARPDLPVQVRVEEVEARHGAEVAEQARLHVLRLQRLPQQRVVEQVDLSDGEVVGGAPVGIDQAELPIAQSRHPGARKGRRRTSASVTIAVVSTSVARHHWQSASITNDLDRKQVRGEQEGRERERRLGKACPLAAAERGDEEPEEADEPERGDRDAEHLGIRRALHGLAAAGRADERAARLPDLDQVGADRRPEGGERRARDPDRPLAHRASAASIAGTIPSAPSDPTSTRSSRPPVGPSWNAGVPLTPAAFAAAAKRSRSGSTASPSAP